MISQIWKMVLQTKNTEIISQNHCVGPNKKEEENNLHAPLWNKSWSLPMVEKGEKSNSRWYPAVTKETIIDRRCEVNLIRLKVVF